jgi:hypothetical protein
MTKMTFQEMADIVSGRSDIEVEPFVYEENNVANTVVFEFDGIVLTLNDDGTYNLAPTGSYGFENFCLV